MVRLFCGRGETGVCSSMISLDEMGFRSCGEGLRIHDGVANGSLGDYYSFPIDCRRSFGLETEKSCCCGRLRGHMPARTRGFEMIPI